MKTEFEKTYMSINQLSKKLNVTRQRVHALIATYGVTTKTFPFAGKMLFVSKTEAKKIPKERPSGVHANSSA